MSLTRTFDNYRHACEQVRDEHLPDDARQRAQDDMIRFRQELDQAFIHNIEPQGVSTSTAASMAGARTATGGVEASEVREFLDRDHPRKSFRLDLESRANEEWWSDTGSTVKAGYTVPTTVLDRVVYHINAESGVFGPSYKLFTSTGEDMTIPVLATDATANLTGEKTASTITNPVFASETLASYRLDGHFVLSNELIRDSAVNIERVVGDAAGRAIATLLADYLATGTGSSEPEGVTVGAAAGVTAAAVDTFTFDEIIELYYDVLPGARKNGTWVAGSDSILKLARLKDGDGNYLWSPAVAAGQPDTLLGKPIFEDADMPSLGTGNVPLVFGDLGNYMWIRIVSRGNTGGILVELDDSVGFTSFTTYARFAMWVDSRVMGTGGEIKKMTMA